MASNQNNNSRQNNKKEPQINTNYQIKGYTVLVLNENSAPSAMSRNDAIALAETQGLDLIQISFDKTTKQPICRIGDYGKYKYEQTKKVKNQKKQNRANLIETKQVQFSITTEDNDMERILNQTKKFLAEGCKVKVALRFRNRRESQQMDLAKSVILGFLNKLTDVATLDSQPSVSGRELSCIIKAIS